MISQKINTIIIPKIVEILQIPQAAEIIEIQEKAAPSKTGKSLLNKGNSNPLIPNLNNPSGIKVSQEKDVEVEELKGNEKQDFNQENFIKAWAAYSGIAKAENKMNLVALMDNYTPTLKDNFLIEIQVENKLQENELTKQKTDLLNYLRPQLRNYAIQIQSIIVEQMENKKPYTSTDKYHFMVKKNPKLEEFRKAFNLDLD